MSLSLLVWNGTRLGDGFGWLQTVNRAWELPREAVWWNIRALYFFLSLSAWTRRSCCGTTPSASPSPQLAGFSQTAPRIPYFPQVKAQLTLKRLWSPEWPGLAYLSGPVPRLLPSGYSHWCLRILGGAILSSPGLCTCHSLFLKHSFHLSSSNWLFILKSDSSGAFSWTPWVWLRYPSSVPS